MHVMKTKLILCLCLIVLLLPISGVLHAQDATSDLINQINSLRAGLGLAPYGLNGALSAAAQNHASWMANTGEVSHTETDGSTPSSRAVAAGYNSSFVSENIYMGTMATADTAWAWWLNSAIHYRGITNPSYTEVGIGAATGIGGTAYVLVFGNPAGYQPPPSAANNGANGEAAAPPSFVVGLDSYGNIMHEIQPGQTLGDIALIYGYTWDDIPTMLALNNLGDVDVRELEIGAVFLVPPYSVTYTPTPMQEGTPAPQAEVSQATPAADVTQTLDVSAILTSETVLFFTPTAATPAPESTLEATAAAVLESGQNSGQLTPSWTVATVTPTAASVAAVSGNTKVSDQSGAAASTPVQIIVKRQTSPLLIAAVVLQVVLLLIAGAEFLRRRR